MISMELIKKDLFALICGLIFYLLILVLFNQPFDIYVVVVIAFLIILFNVLERFFKPKEKDA